MIGTTGAPRLETDRLVMRAHCLDDYQACARLWADADVTRFIGGSPASLQESWFRLLRYAGHWQLLGYGYWVVEERETGRYAGEIGFADARRDIKPSLTGMPESGWALAPWAQGKGYASEALAAVLAWGDEAFRKQTTCCIISPDNLPSLRVAEKNGYVEYARAIYMGSPTVLFHRDP
jgi:RimJ/RimL family protein N-acetyltransferase